MGNRHKTGKQCCTSYILDSRLRGNDRGEDNGRVGDDDKGEGGLHLFYDLDSEEIFQAMFDGFCGEVAKE